MSIDDRRKFFMAFGTFFAVNGMILSFCKTVIDIPCSTWIFVWISLACFRIAQTISDKK
jgi:hypothetical protein